MRILPVLMLVTTTLAAQTPVPPELVRGRDQLASRQYREALATFRAYEKVDPKNVMAAMGEGDAELRLNEFDGAELAYRRAVAIQPENWVAHQALVRVEAKLGRWEEFDRERAILRAARERDAPNISTHESDVIDSFISNAMTPATRLWTVREYFEPMGRSLARYNFESLGKNGGTEYISLEPQQAAEQALSRDAQVKIGATPKAFGDVSMWSLNWYNARGHGTIRTYTHGEPSYETLRADVMRWLRNPAKK